jgi:dolichol kinase
VQISHNLACDLVLDSREVVRKLWHMIPGTLILGLPLLRQDGLILSHLPAMIVLFTAVLFVLSLVHAKRFTRPGERDWSTSVAAFAATALVPLVLFPAHEELALTALVILAFGDGAAALGGMGLRGPTLPWNEKKTLAGTLSFIVCAAPCATWIYWGISNPRVSLEIALINGVAAAAVAAVAESVRSSINDNIRVGVAATSTLLLLHWCMLGA